jgi:DNA-binding transcriptional ArsR family regulator
MHIFGNDEMRTSDAAEPARLPALVAAAKAMGHPTRLRLLAMLQSGSLCVCQMTAVLGLAASTVSGHLAELRRAGLVTERKEGKWVEYSLADRGGPSALLRPVLAQLARDPESGRDAATVAALRRVPRETLCEVGLDLSAVGVGGAGRRRPRPAGRRKAR